MAVQKCTLSIEQLNELAGRLFVLAEHTLADRQAAADMRNAARACSDLSGTRFGIDEIADKLMKYPDAIKLKQKTKLTEIHADIINFMDELNDLIGKSLEDEERAIAEGRQI
jgi:hypothetical protein